MPSLKDLRVRIRSVRSTQKITSAMKVVAASRLRRAQWSRPRPPAPTRSGWSAYWARSPAAWPGCRGARRCSSAPAGKKPNLVVVATSDRGLAGGFNASILREARRRIRELEAAGKTVLILIIGRKGRDGLRRDYGRLIRDSLTEVGRRRLSFEEARDVAERSWSSTKPVPSMSARSFTTGSGRR